MRSISKSRRRLNFQEAGIGKKIVAVFIFLVIMLGGLFMGVVGIAKIQNYHHPFLFAFVFGVTGFIASVFFARWVKPYALLSATADYAMATWMFAIGCAGPGERSMVNKS